MRRVTAIVLSVAMSLFSTTPLLAAPAPQAPATASISGTATDASGHALANTTVQLRNVQSAQLAGTTTSTTTGQFGFTGLNPGTFSVEVVNPAGGIVGTSSAISVAAGQAVTGVAVSASAALAGAAGVAGATAAGTAGATGAAAAAGSGAFLASTAGILTVAAVGAGVVGAVVAVNKSSASPSQ